MNAHCTHGTTKCTVLITRVDRNQNNHKKANQFIKIMIEWKNVRCEILPDEKKIYIFFFSLSLIIMYSNSNFPIK